jgi:hypothetical protein
MNRPAEFVPNAFRARQPRRGRPVVDPNGVEHASITQAAIAHCLWPAVVYQKYCKRHLGWRFADDPLIAPAPTPGVGG